MIDIIYTYYFKKHNFIVVKITCEEENSFVNKKNIIKFLENKFIDENIKFKEYYKPVTILFIHSGTLNKIYMKCLSLNSNKNFVIGSGLMDVYIYSQRKKVVITEKFLEIYGHTKNFYQHIYGCYNVMLFMTLKEYKGKYIYMMNEYGKLSKHHNTIKKDIKLNN